jgi:hypothetical protein
MSAMFEVLYQSPPDASREMVISDCARRYGGQLTYREEPDLAGIGPVCLTYEFSDLAVAGQAADALRSHGEHVEGPSAYGD